MKDILANHIAPCAWAAAVLAWPHCALSQQYPLRPVRIVVASTPGSGPDVVARMKKLLGE